MNNNRDMLPGETMFDYLKRKKKYMLQKTINRSKANKQSDSFDNSFRNNDSVDGMPVTKRNQSKQTNHRSNIRNQNVDSQSATPTRVGLIEQERRPATRSFLQLISPIRSKSPIQKDADMSLKSSPRFSKKDSSKNNYTKKVIQDHINNLREMIQTLVKSGTNLKQKFRHLTIELQPFFRHMEFCEDSKFQKKTEIIKSQLKVVERYFSDFNIETTNNAIQSMFLKFSQHIDELEGRALAQIQSNKEDLISQITSNKNLEIAHLQDANKKLERDLLNQKKKLQKLELKYEQLQSQVQNNYGHIESQNLSAIKRYQQGLQYLQQTNYALKNETKALSEELAAKESQIKRLKYQKDKIQQECFSTISKVKGEQQQFLLNEIMVLKTEFNHDINQMASLHKAKEEELLGRINRINKDNQMAERRLNELIKSNIQMEELTKAERAQSSRFKKQNQLLASDMHRINEELYQHWLALKDIKVLSMRLDIFPKFKKIYDEMLFNEQLFL